MALVTHKKTCSTNRKGSYPLKARGSRPSGRSKSDGKSALISVPASFADRRDELLTKSKLLRDRKGRKFTRPTFEKLEVLVSLLSRQQLHSSHSKNEGVFREIPAEKIQHAFGTHYSKVLDLGIALGVIRRRNHYIVDQKCMEYEVKKEFMRGAPVKISTSRKKIVDKFKKSTEAKENEHIATVKKTLKKIRIRVAPAKEKCHAEHKREVDEINSRYDGYVEQAKSSTQGHLSIHHERGSVPMTIEDLNKHRSEELADADGRLFYHLRDVERIVEGDFSIKVDDFGRCHHNIVSLWSPLREEIYIKGCAQESFTVDVSNSQLHVIAVFLTRIAKGHYSKGDLRHELQRKIVHCATRGDSFVNTAKSQEIVSKQMNQRIQEAIHGTGREYEAVNMQADDVDTLWKAADDIISAITNIGSTDPGFKKELKEFAKSCSEGVFYEMHALRLDTAAGGGTFYRDWLARDRGGFKGYSFGGIYADQECEHNKRNTEAWEKAYPKIWEVLGIVKAIHKSVLPKLMQMMESEIYIPVVTAMSEQGFEVLGMHDGLILYGNNQKWCMELAKALTEIPSGEYVESKVNVKPCMGAARDNEGESSEDVEAATQEAAMAVATMAIGEAKARMENALLATAQPSTATICCRNSKNIKHVVLSHRSPRWRTSNRWLDRPSRGPP